MCLGFDLFLVGYCGWLVAGFVVVGVVLDWLV